MEQQLPGTHFRERLRQELTQRFENNPSYSLRSFAKQLNISASSLSMVMGGKCPVTLKLIEKISSKLKLEETEIHEFQLNLLKEKTSINYKLKEFELIDQDQFEMIKEWYHYAILNLMRTKGFQQKPAWIARRLGISLGEVQTAVERLQSVGILEVRKGKWFDRSSQFTSHTNNKKFSEAARYNQVQLFEKAKHAIESVEFEKRNHTGVTLAFAQNDLARAKDFITRFRKEFLTEFDRTSNADEVYQMSVALYPLSEKQK